MRSIFALEQSDSPYNQQIIDISWLEFSSSLILIALTFFLSFPLKLQIEKSLFFASFRAAVQLLAVGIFFTAIFDHSI